MSTLTTVVTEFIQEFQEGAKLMREGLAEQREEANQESESQLAGTFMHIAKSLIKRSSNQDEEPYDPVRLDDEFELESYLPETPRPTDLRVTNDSPTQHTQHNSITAELLAGARALSFADRHIFELNLSDLLDKSTQYKKNWLLNVIAARQRFERQQATFEGIQTLSIANSKLVKWITTGRAS